MTLKPGIRLGPYEILSPLPVVGVGEIHRGRDHEQGRDVVVRVLRIATDADPALLPRLAADVLEAGALTHPAIPKIYDVGTTADTIYIVCEPFDGETLRALIDRGALTVDAATECITQVASALAVAGKQRIAHGDLRAENVLLTSERRTLVLGFGLAAATADNAPSDDLAFDALCRDLLPEGPPKGAALPWRRRPAVAIAVALLVLAVGIAVAVTRTSQRAVESPRMSATARDGGVTLNASPAAPVVPPPVQTTEGGVVRETLVPTEEAAAVEVDAGAAPVAATEPADAALTATEPPDATSTALVELPDAAPATATEELEAESGEGLEPTDRDDLTGAGGDEPLLIAGDAAPASPLPEAVAERPPVSPVLGADGRDARSLIAEAIIRAAEFDLPGAMTLLGVTAERGDAWSEVALIYLRGLVDAREAFRDGGAVAALAPVLGAIEYLASLSQGRRGSAEIGRLVLQAAAAAQSERDEMRLYLETAIQMEVIQSAAGFPGAPLVSATEIAGYLWLQVDRYEDARQAYADATDRIGPSLRTMLGSARASSRLRDVLTACSSYGDLLDTWGTRPGLPPEIVEAQTYIDTICASAETPDTETHDAEASA